MHNRNARVRLRRRLEKKYKIYRVSITNKKIDDKIVPKINIIIDMNRRKDDFIDDNYPKFKSEDTNFVIKIVYYEDEYSDYKITFMVDGIDIGINRIKMVSMGEILDNVIPELKKIYKEIEKL